ncbi:MAG: hypothetical protein AAF688_09020 [Bacteroidota bacterium]
MKPFKLVLKLLTITFISALTFSSCSENEDEVVTETITTDALEVQLSAEIDQVDNILGDLIIDAYEEQEIDELDRVAYSASIPECVTITLVAQQNFREVTLDFGTEGCFVNGHLLRGQIVFDYTRNPEAQQIAINYNLVDFFFDAKNVIGSRSILRELSNENGNPQFTHNLNITVIWPNGLQASREGTRIREWVEGFGSGTFSDNVFEITGDWTANFVNGNTHSYEVQIPLRREIGCAYLVSGSFSVERTNFGGLFDYGDGECDNQATFTFNNDQTIDITL